MNVWRKLLLVGGTVVLVLGSSAFSQEAAVAEEETAAETEELAGDAAEEEPAAVAEAPAVLAAPPGVVDASAPAPAPAPAAVVEEPKKAAVGLTVTPYGRAHYRFREQINTRSDTAVLGANRKTIADYTNRLAWQLGLKATVNEQVSMQFQIGNDWGSPENVTYALNNGIRSRFTTYQNLYIHLAYARWDPGYLFVEAGVVPLVSHGTLDLLESSLSRGRYYETVFDGWSQYNNSMIGFKLGAPIVKGDVKVSAELFQTVIDPRGQVMPADGKLYEEVTANPASVLMVLTVPIDMGDLKITPQLTGVLNRNYNTATEEGDNEGIAGLSANYKINNDVSVSLNGGYATINNDNSRVGSYGIPSGATVPSRGGSVKAADAENVTPFYANGMLLGAGTSVKAGPGTAQFNINWNYTQNGLSDATIDATRFDFLNTDLRYTYRLNKNFSVMPRYRTDTVYYPKKNVNDVEFRQRFELVFEGSF
jgi:hypothetical protein